MLCPAVLTGCGRQQTTEMLELPVRQEKTADATGDETRQPDPAKQETADASEAEAQYQDPAGQENADLQTAETKSDAGMYYVYVCGAVVRPDVYRMPADARVFEAVELAGGFSETADKDALNLAAFIQDGMQICVPREGEHGGLITSDNAAGVPADAPVDLNTADAALLMTLPGIGEVKANNILSYRQEHGSFQSVEELLEVSGIGNALYEQVKDRVTI